MMGPIWTKKEANAIRISRNKQFGGGFGVTFIRHY